MSVKFSPTSNITKLIIVVELILVIYLLNTLTISVYRGYQLDKVIAVYEKENDVIEADNRKKIEDYEYFTSKNYIEKIAKQNLGLINYGEEVIVIPKIEEIEIMDMNEEYYEGLSDLSNAQKWWIFFFDRSGPLQ